MNGSINWRELWLKATAGLIGGAVGWLPVELVSHGRTLTQQLTPAEQYASEGAMMLLSGLIGGLILAAEGQELRVDAKAVKSFLLGFGVCFVLAYFSDQLSNGVFTNILQYGGWTSSREGSTAYLFVARVVSWMIMGGMLGAGVGIATLRIPNIIKGGIGGLVGGFIGGVLFDPLGRLMSSGLGSQGLASRFIGLSVIGLAIGLFIGLVQELTKAAWITVDQGRLKGRQFRIEGAQVTMGRAEENPIGLFGDQGVQQRHAVIERKGSDYTIRNIAVQDGTFVNGARIETATLHDGDEIKIGGYQLGFHLRQSSDVATVRAQAPSRIAAVASSGAMGAGPCLIDSEGQRFALRAGASTRLGRALDNDIVINHSSVSRHHASIEAVNGAFELRDLQSQNGTWVSDERVTQKRIADGDSIRLGQAPFIFRA